MATRRTKNTKGRIDPYRPKLPPTCTVIAEAVEGAPGSITLTAVEPLQYNPAGADEGTGDACPGIVMYDASGAILPGTVTIGPANVATVTLNGGTLALPGTLVLSPLTQALKSVRGGVLALGQIVFPGA